MKESVAAFIRRTGSTYEPPPSIARIARPLAEEEECPTLFRFPGPCGLLAHFLGELTHLGPQPPGVTSELWAADATVHSEANGAALFGTFAILEPLRFAMAVSPLPATAQLWVGENRPIDDPGRVVWIPPSAVRAPIPWDRIADAAHAREFLGAVEREENVVKESLSLYLEELLEVARAGVPDPARKWCDRPREERQRVLAEYGLDARWTATASG